MHTHSTIVQRLLRGDLSVIFYLSAAKLILHLLVNATGGYGLFRDEFYYVACSENLAAGYVDQPPLCAILLRGMTTLIGDSLFSIRLLPAIVAALTTFFVGLVTVRIGGGRLAQIIACLMSFSAINLAMGGFYSMNCLDILFWTITAYVIVLIIQKENKGLWLLLGTILGAGLLNKIGVLFLGAGIFVGLIVTSHRRWFLTPWPYIAGTIALIFFIPYIVWNFQHDFAHLEFIHNASAEKYSSLSAISFLAGQVMINNPGSIFVWVAGLIFIFTSNDMKPYRILAWMYIVPLLILILNGTSKSEYLSPAYGMLYAAGGVFWEKLAFRATGWKYALGIVMGFWLLLALIALPIILPILPVEKYITYSNAIGFKPESSEGKEQSELPQFYADMFGWKEKVKGVVDAYNTLNEEEKKQCAIFSNNYGRCASIDYYGKDYGLPRTIGNHNNYWIWGPRGYSGDVMIIVGGDLEDHAPNFREVKLSTIVDCQYCMPYEDNVPIFVCKGIKGDLNAIWPEEKHFE
jgi:hypothetical protein